MAQRRTCGSSMAPRPMAAHRPPRAVIWHRRHRPTPPWTPSMPPPSAPQARTTAHPACAPTTTPIATGPSSLTWKATTWGRCAIGRSRLRTAIRFHRTGGFTFELPDCAAASNKDGRAPFRTGREPGLAPAGEVLVLCVAKEKYPKERRPCSLRPLRGKPAAGRLRGAPHNSLRCCAAAFGQTRRVR